MSDRDWAEFLVFGECRCEGGESTGVCTRGCVCKRGDEGAKVLRGV